jgi:hypothetical protein
VITPALHRRHHSREARLLDSNYGTILSLWDRWFGTHASNPSDRQIEAGLPGLGTHVGAGAVLGLPVRACSAAARARAW